MPDTAKFRYVGDEPRSVSILPAGALRRLEPDQLFEVPAEHWASYACQPKLFEALSEDPERVGQEKVLADVDGDPEAARRALDDERRALKPRRRLIAELEKIVSAPALDPLANVTREGDGDAQPAPAEGPAEPAPVDGSTDNATEPAPPAEDTSN